MTQITYYAYTKYDLLLVGTLNADGTRTRDNKHHHNIKNNN